MFLLLENSKRSRLALKNSIAGAALLCGTCCVAPMAGAQSPPGDPANHAWQAGAIAHAQRMRAFFDRNNGQQPTPPVIPKFEIDPDPFGSIATLQPDGPTQTSQNAFFANLGTNQRTCFSCHQPQNGWTVSAASVKARFYVSQGNDPYSVSSTGPRAPATTFRRSMRRSRPTTCCWKRD